MCIRDRQLAFVKADPVAGIEVAYTPVLGTSTSEDIKWLSLLTSGGAYSANGVTTTQVTYTFPFGTSGTYTSTFAGTIATDKSQVYTGVVSVGISTRLKIVGLADSTWNSYAKFNTLTKFDGYVISNSAWNTLIQSRVTLP